MQVRARSLTSEVFAPYGQVLMALGEEAHRNEFAAHLANHRPHARLNMAFVLTKPTDATVTLRALERHPYSSQSFVPVDGTRYLVAVCPATPRGDPDLERLVAFIAEGTQAVNYNPGAWHAPHTVLGGSGKFIMLRWDDGTEADVEVRPLQSGITVALDE
jgi:ureidoglycolate lyase